MNPVVVIRYGEARWVPRFDRRLMIIEADGFETTG
jgi:hypothetical protein